MHFSHLNAPNTHRLAFGCTSTTKATVYQCTFIPAFLPQIRNGDRDCLLDDLHCRCQCELATVD